MSKHLSQFGNNTLFEDVYFCKDVEAIFLVFISNYGTINNCEDLGEKIYVETQRSCFHNIFKAFTSMQLFWNLPRVMKAWALTVGDSWCLESGVLWFSTK